ncbi:hypothetical protein ACLK1S_27400 [Escherichia coli]
MRQVNEIRWRLKRIRLAMKNGNAGLVTVLAGQLLPITETIASAMISLANNPNTVLTFARTTGATDFTRQMAAVAFAVWRGRMLKMHG